ncbi:hypothetical protein BH20VER2_BH20VER2_02170 [soil metagenome]
MQEVVIVTPELTPGGGGVGDYTLRVLEQWEGLVAPVFPESPAELPAQDGRLLVQYSAYGFDRFGYPRGLLRALRDWKQNGGGRLVIMFHEIWSFWPWLNKNWIVQAAHRRDLRKLLPHVDAIFTSTASQAEHLRRLASGVKVEVLPVGSNVRVVQPQESTRRRGAAVLFGLQGSRARALRALGDELQALAAAQKITRLTTAGGGGVDEEREILRELRFADGWVQRGALPEAEISALLAGASFGISAQDELSITKSGTFMAYAAHGLNIVSPAAGPARAEPLCWATHPQELRQGISDAELAARAAHLREWQERTSSWPRIAERFAQALQLPAA